MKLLHKCLLNDFIEIASVQVLCVRLLHDACGSKIRIQIMLYKPCVYFTLESEIRDGMFVQACVADVRSRFYCAAVYVARLELPYCNR